MKTNKDDIIGNLLEHPLEFEENGGVKFLLSKKDFNFSNLREIIKRIYDINESQLKETSNANYGTMGYMNRMSTTKRLKQFKKKIKKQESGKTYYKIYAEGDSWFQFPIFITDIIDWLNKRDEFMVYSDAYGGDWITNILYEEQYVAGLSTYSPDVFLISGGGNDLAGNHRLGIMVDKISNYEHRKYKNIQEIDSKILDEDQKKVILNSQKYINKEFYALLLVFKLQYSLLFDKLYNKTDKFKNLISITHGYDYPIPDCRRRFSIRYPFQILLNSFLDSGNWLSMPLMIKGILDKKTQKEILFTMIYEFNEMLSSFALKFTNVFHIDNRGLAAGQNEWFDELHYKSHIYKKVANIYEKVIKNEKNIRMKKIIRTIEYEIII